MARTIYEPAQGRFSDKAHIAAQGQIYRPFFSSMPGANYSQNLHFKSHRVGKNQKDTFLDGSFGIDLTVTTPKPPHLQVGMQWTIQERFRRSEKYKSFNDITVTEFNTCSGLASELSKIQAAFFVYGFFDESTNLFTDAHIIHMQRLKYLIHQKDIPFGRNVNEKGQTFLTILVNDLYQKNCIAWSYYQ